GMKLLLLALFLLLPTSTPEAATYWVSKSSDGNQHCFNSATQPGNLATRTSLTINQGISCMSSGDTLYVMSGTYDGTIGANRQPNPDSCISAACIPNGISASQMTTVSAAPGHERKARVINSGGDRPVIFRGHSRYIKIAGFELDGQNQGGYVFEMSCTS